MSKRARRSRVPASTSETLWLKGAGLDRAMLSYTVGDDRYWDGFLLPWDVSVLDWARASVNPFFAS